MDHTIFLLKYAKIGVLESLKNLDEIDAEELKQEYLRIKQELKSPQETKGSNKKESVVKKWFRGIGNRRRKYLNEHKGNL